MGTASKVNVVASVTSNEHGEIVIDGTADLKSVKQTVPARYPCAVFYNPDNQNFYSIYLDVPSTWKLFDIYMSAP